MLKKKNWERNNKSNPPPPPPQRLFHGWRGIAAFAPTHLPAFQAIFFLDPPLRSWGPHGIMFHVTAALRGDFNRMASQVRLVRWSEAVADPRGGGRRISRGPPLFSANICFLADFFLFRARHRGIWIPAPPPPPFSQILDPPLRRIPSDHLLCVFDFFFSTQFCSLDFSLTNP